MKEWDLSKLYQSFDDSSFTTDFNQIIKLQKQINTYRNNNDEKSLENYLVDLIELNQQAYTHNEVRNLLATIIQDKIDEKMCIRDRMSGVPVAIWLITSLSKKHCKML